MFFLSLEPSGYCVIDKDMARAYNKEPYSEISYRIYRF